MRVNSPFLNHSLLVNYPTRSTVILGLKPFTLFFGHFCRVNFNSSGLEPVKNSNLLVLTQNERIFHPNLRLGEPVLSVFTRNSHICLIHVESKSIPQYDLRNKKKKCNFYLLMKDKNTLMKLTRDFGNNNNF